MPTARPARFWEPAPQAGKLRCTLCPRDCVIGEGQAGFCFIRRVEDGRMVTYGYGASGFAVDPIEKKPLNHFLPGTQILSFGTAGCNLGCKFCQNWSISKTRIEDLESLELTPEDIVALARREGCPSIAMTYNDPVIFAECAIDVARAARKAGLHPVLVSAGYVTASARPELYAEVSAANIDLKGFTEDFYRKVTLAHLAPVLETLVWLRKSTSVWLEVTNLMIPGHNDDPAETRRLAEWIGAELGPDTPLHFTAFHPDFKMLDVPRTPPSTLVEARRVAREVGLRHVYVGNVHDRGGQTTYCGSCREPLIERDWYMLGAYRMQGAACSVCGSRVPGVFADKAPSLGGGLRRRLPFAVI